MAENREKRTVRIGTRKSALAVVQTRLVAEAIEKTCSRAKAELVTRETMGDRILNKPLLEFGGKGVFVSEFEQGLTDGTIDLAVHSAKDMPMELGEGLAILAVPEREDPRDVLVVRKGTVLSGRDEVVVGTSSPRRAVQIRELGSKLWDRAAVRCEVLRGNVNTRLRKLGEGGYDAIILAAAGLKRLGFLDSREEVPQGELQEDGRFFQYQYLDCESFIPAGGQGILAVEGRESDEEIREICGRLEDRDARICLETERKVLRLLNAGCHEPIGVYTRMAETGEIELFGICGRGGIIRRTHRKAAAELAGELAEAGAAELAGEMEMPTAGEPAGRRVSVGQTGELPENGQETSRKTERSS